MTLPSILFMGGSDNANISNRVCAGLRSLGCNARTLTIKAHPFGYEQDLVGDGGIAELIEDNVRFDWVIGVGDSNYGAFEKLVKKLGPVVASAKRAIRHGGTAFRSKPAFCNKRDLGFRRRFVGSDLLRLASAKPPTAPYFAPPETILAAPTWLGSCGEREPIRVGHSPSKRAQKGTETILAALQGIKGIELDLIEGVPFAECAKRRSRCHLFVDQMNPAIGGFGASTVEALSAGCIVLADIRHIVPRVWDFYPRPPISDVRTGLELRERIEFLIRDRGLVTMMRREAHAWVTKNATPEAIGAYWLKHLGVET